MSRSPWFKPSNASAWKSWASSSLGQSRAMAAIASAYAVSRRAFGPSPYRISTARRYPFSRGVGARATRAAGLGPSRRSAARAAAASCSFHTACVYVIASPQYAMANAESRRWASRNSAQGRGILEAVQKKYAGDEVLLGRGVPDVGKSMWPSRCARPSCGATRRANSRTACLR